MTKQEIIDVLVDNYHEDLENLKTMKKDELKELLDEYSDDSSMFPNGRNTDAENWDD